jgi:hypothetical protein
MSTPIHVHYSCGCHHQPSPKMELVGDKLNITIKAKCQVCGKGDSTELIVGEMSINATRQCPPDCQCDEMTAMVPLNMQKIQEDFGRPRKRRIHK